MNPQAFVDVEALEADPYPTYARLRASASPAVWVEPLGMWWVTQYEAVRELLLNDADFTTASPRSIIQDTFGSQILSSDGDLHRRYRMSTQGAFSPRAIREAHSADVAAVVGDLVEGLSGRREAELRSAFACRLPVRMMLRAGGLREEDEPTIRRWYDLFEQRLADVSEDSALREQARTAADEFRELLGARVRGSEPGGLVLEIVRQAVRSGDLSQEEAERNLLLIFFGGISTVEALILNTLWALFQHPEALAAVRMDPDLAPVAVEETMRWLSPVQSATRFVIRDTELAGVPLRAGQKIAGMIGAANRDPAAFPAPERFDLTRQNSRQHLGFATGPHVCLGMHLARVEASSAVQALLARYPSMSFDRERSGEPRGFEFRQPRTFCVTLGDSAERDGGLP